MKKRWMVWAAMFSVSAALAGCSGGVLIRDRKTSGQAAQAGRGTAGAENGSGGSGRDEKKQAGANAGGAFRTAGRAAGAFDIRGAERGL